MRGKFITIEGVEGAGKSTAISAIEHYLTSTHTDFILTREPGGTPLGEKIRELLLDKDNHAMCDTTELLLMFAARAQHMQQKIVPALALGQWVVCDRFTDATYAYQGGGRQLSFEPIQILEEMVQEELRPDLTIILDVPPEVGLKRVEQRGQKDRFEQEAVSFFNRVRQVYLDRSKQDPDRYYVVDASQSMEIVASTISAILSKYLNK